LFNLRGELRKLSSKVKLNKEAAFGKRNATHHKHGSAPGLV
jgi:hypothetical protein